MIAEAERKGHMPDPYGKVENLMPGIITGLKETRATINRDLLKPSLSSRNNKMGRLLSFSVLAVLTCPEHSTCASSCYAIGMQYKRATAWKTFAAYLRNSWLVHWRPDLVERAVLLKVARARKKYSEFRLNVSGDVPNQKVADFWSTVGYQVRELGTRFYGYTKADVSSPYLLRSVFIVGQGRLESANAAASLLDQGLTPAVTGTISQLRTLQKDVKGLVICPELMAKHQGRENPPGCDVCHLCATALEPESKIRAIGFPLHVGGHIFE